MSLFPRQDTLHQAFGKPAVVGRFPGGPRPKATPYQARPELFGAYSVVDDAKNKAQKLGNEAAKELEAASQKTQQKTGKIELYSGEYYAACTFGGLLACVCTSFFLPLFASNPFPGMIAKES